MTKTIVRINQKEFVDIIKTVGSLDLVFGPGWMGFELDNEKPISEQLIAQLERLAALRGISSENLEGNGI